MHSIYWCSAGLYGKGLVERALIDEILDSSEDLGGSVIAPVAFNKDEEAKKKGTAELLKKDGSFAYWMGKFELRLKENKERGNKNGYLVGDSITIADLKFNSLFTYVEMVPGAMDFVKANYPLCTAFNELVNNNEKIKAFNVQFEKNQAASQKDGIKIFKYAGKSVYSDL